MFEFFIIKKIWKYKTRQKIKNLITIFSLSVVALEGLHLQGLLLRMEQKLDLQTLSNHLQQEQSGVWEVLILLSLGTCVNVGCIPKKLFHHIAQMGELRNDMNESGWTVDKSHKHKWEVAS